MYLEEVNVNTGIIANGSWIDITVFKMSLIPEKVFMSMKYARENVGAIAMLLVSNNLKNINSSRSPLQVSKSA